MKLFYDGSVAHPGLEANTSSRLDDMPKAPGDVQNYVGDADWFKIWESTICDENEDLTKTAWCTYPGQYLVRAEHVGLHGAQNNAAEIFTGFQLRPGQCSESGIGMPSPIYQIPGIYNDTMKFFNGLNLRVDNAATIKADIAKTPIGDAVWNGSSSSSSLIKGNSMPDSPSSAKVACAAKASVNAAFSVPAAASSTAAAPSARCGSAKFRCDMM
ncbi:hypothetical protein TruAng_002505 [Truncatella angustata]|nr:hypothetical protein TruAng_002505 [Truncatella angustata]